MMKINNRFQYLTLEKVTLESGMRYYTCPVTNKKLPSVTSILSSTEDKTGLLEWRARVGDEKANEIRDEALRLGSLMHLHIENYVMGIPRPRGNNIIRVQAERMADQIIAHGLPNVDEVWGQEVMLFYPGLYAGTTDLVGVYRGKQAVMDHKTSKKMKKREDILNYRDQLSAYAMAHNDLYDTEIYIGVIFMVDRQLNFQEFVYDMEDISVGQTAWIDRLERYITENPISE